jgi:hypothetical protein
VSLYRLAKNTKEENPENTSRRSHVGDIEVGARAVALHLALSRRGVVQGGAPGSGLGRPIACLETSLGNLIRQ